MTTLQQHTAAASRRWSFSLGRLFAGFTLIGIGMAGLVAIVKMALASSSPIGLESLGCVMLIWTGLCLPFMRLRTALVAAFVASLVTVCGLLGFLAWDFGLVAGPWNGSGPTTH